MVLAQHAGAADFTQHNLAVIALLVFCGAYLLVVLEDVLKLRKCKPVILAAAVMWILVALVMPEDRHVEEKVMHHLAEFAALFLFLMVAMTFISAIAERNVFLALNAWLVSRGWGLRTVFWITGFLSFWISPVADNMTTALLMGTVAISVGRGNTRFISASCASIVIAANAGGAFSPFGDVTTLMVWAAGKVPFGGFLGILLPSMVNWLIPALCMHFALGKDKPAPLEERVELKRGWFAVIVLFALTIATAVLFHAKLHLPPFLGMMFGLGYLLLYGHFEQRRQRRRGEQVTVDMLKNVAHVEWDTLLFFFGVIMCVGALQDLGYLAKASQALYGELGATKANIAIGVISAVIDNVPVMFAVLKMDPAMNVDQWLLVTLTAGVGGSLLSVGSAAGVALMGAAHGKYTFTSHLRWLPAIALGYVGSIACHIALHPQLLQE